MNARERALSGLSINLSISEGENSGAQGFPAWQLNRITLQVASALLGQGVALVLGHDWREDGIMEAIYTFATQIRSPFTAAHEEPAQPLVRNLLPWPDRSRLSDDDRERLRGILSVEEAGLPEELSGYDADARGSGDGYPLYQYLRARGLTHLRHELGEAVDARLCLGGRTAGSSGRFPGVIEEAYLALQTGKPLYLAGFLGGATQELVKAISGEEMPDSFCLDTRMAQLYEEPPVKENDPGTHADRIRDARAVWATFEDAGLAKLARANGLSTDENEELLFSPALDGVIELVLRGLGRLRGERD